MQVGNGFRSRAQTESVHATELSKLLERDHRRLAVRGGEDFQTPKIPHTSASARSTPTVFAAHGARRLKSFEPFTTENVAIKPINTELVHFANSLRPF